MLKEAPALRVRAGNRVYLRTDPSKGLGTVMEVLHGRFIVRWDDGHAWVYPMCDLEVV